MFWFPCINAFSRTPDIEQLTFFIAISFSSSASSTSIIWEPTASCRRLTFSLVYVVLAEEWSESAR